MLKKSYIHRAFASLCIAAMLCGNLTAFAAITDLNGEIEGDRGVSNNGRNARWFTKGR